MENFRFTEKQAREQQRAHALRKNAAQNNSCNPVNIHRTKKCACNEKNRGFTICVRNVSTVFCATSSRTTSGLHFSSDSCSCCWYHYTKS